MKKLNAVVIGAGSIGALKPDNLDSPDTKNTLTMAHAFYNNPAIDLIGIVDHGMMKATMAANKWKTNPYTSLSQIKEKIDIIAVCVNTENHKAVLIECLQYDPQIVIAEKPFCDNYEDALEVCSLYLRRGIPIIVDYIRRYSPAIYYTCKAIAAGEYGKPQAARLYYTRGFVRDGCHAIDTFNLMFGKFKCGSLLEPSINDYSKEDLTHGAILHYEKCPYVLMLPCDGREFDIFDLEIITTEGAISFTDHFKKIRMYKKEEETTYGNYSSLSLDKCSAEIPTNLETALDNLVAEAVEYIAKNIIITSDHSTATQVHYILEKLLEEKTK